MTHIPLGIPGTRPDSTPSKPNDMASHVRRAYKYQDYVAFTLVCASLRDNQYMEVWLEHHDDILAIRSDGQYDVYQVKTRSSEDSKWKLRDSEIGKIIKKFAALERTHGKLINKYYLYSNIGPYVPAEHARTEESLADSLLVLQNKIQEFCVDELQEQYQKSFAYLLEASNTNEYELIAVLNKLAFKTGAAISRFTTDSYNDLATIDPQLDSWSAKDLKSLQKNLIEKITRASDVDVPPLLLNESELTSSGIPLAEIESRRVTIESFRNEINYRLKRKKKTKILTLFIGVVLVGVIVALLRPIAGTGPLEQAVDTIKSARGNVLPPSFKESVAIVRSAGMSLMEIDLTGAHLACQDMSGLDVRRINGSYMKATGLIFDQSILSGAMLTHSELNMSKFRNARMDMAWFDESNLLASNFFGVEARGASFKNATLQGANMSHSNFSGANFNNAQMELTELVNSDMSSANLEGARFRDANISGLNLIKARHLTQAMVDATCNEEKHPPKLDKHLKPSNRPCFLSPDKQFERKVKRLLLGFTGANVATFGYCKKNEVVFRPPDSKSHPEGNEGIFLDFSEIDDPITHVHK